MYASPSRGFSRVPSFFEKLCVESSAAHRICVTHGVSLTSSGLDELDIFTDDLFVDGLQREGDIFKVYRDLRVMYMIGQNL